MTERLAEIKARYAKVPKGKFIEDEVYQTILVPCELCKGEGQIACPCCEANEETDTRLFDLEGPFACGVQVFGIGKDLEALEAFVKHSREDMSFLLNQLKIHRKALDAVISNSTHHGTFSQAEIDEIRTNALEDAEHNWDDEE